jgi:hypothetical protein
MLSTPQVSQAYALIAYRYYSYDSEERPSLRLYRPRRTVRHERIDESGETLR